MLSSETLLSYIDKIIIFALHTDASDKQFGGVIIKINKPITLLSRGISKPQCNYTTNKKELLVIV